MWNLNICIWIVFFIVFYSMIGLFYVRIRIVIIIDGKFIGIDEGYNLGCLNFFIEV